VVTREQLGVFAMQLLDGARAPSYLFFAKFMVDYFNQWPMTKYLNEERVIVLLHDKDPSP